MFIVFVQHIVVSRFAIMSLVNRELAALLLLPFGDMC